MFWEFGKFFAFTESVSTDAKIVQLLYYYNLSFLSIHILLIFENR